MPAAILLIADGLGVQVASLLERRSLSFHAVPCDPPPGNAFTIYDPTGDELAPGTVAQISEAAQDVNFGSPGFQSVCELAVTLTSVEQD